MSTTMSNTYNQKTTKADILYSSFIQFYLPKNFDDINDKNNQLTVDEYCAILKGIFTDPFEKFYNKDGLAILPTITTSGLKYCDIGLLPNDYCYGLEKIIKFYAYPCNSNDIGKYFPEITNGEIRKIISDKVITSIICVKRSAETKTNISQEDFEKFLNKEVDLKITDNEKEYLDKHFFTLKELLSIARRIGNNWNKISEEDNSPHELLHIRIKDEFDNFAANLEKDNTLKDFLAVFKYQKSEINNTLKELLKRNIYSNIYITLAQKASIVSDMNRPLWEINRKDFNLTAQQTKTLVSLFKEEIQKYKEKNFYEYDKQLRIFLEKIRLKTITTSFNNIDQDTINKIVFKHGLTDSQQKLFELKLAIDLVKNRFKVFGKEKDFSQFAINEILNDANNILVMEYNDLDKQIGKSIDTIAADLFKEEVKSFLSNSFAEIYNQENQLSLEQYCQALKDILANPYKAGDIKEKHEYKTWISGNTEFTNTTTIPYLDLPEYEQLGLLSKQLHEVFKLYAYPGSFKNIKNINITNGDIRKIILDAFIDHVIALKRSKDGNIPDEKNNLKLTDDELQFLAKNFFINNKPLDKELALKTTDYTLLQAFDLKQGAIKNDELIVSDHNTGSSLVISEFIDHFKQAATKELTEKINSKQQTNELGKISIGNYINKKVTKFKQALENRTLHHKQSLKNQELLTKYEAAIKSKEGAFWAFKDAQDFLNKNNAIVITTTKTKDDISSQSEEEVPITEADKKRILWELGREASIANINLENYQALLTPAKLIRSLPNKEIEEINADLRKTFNNYLFLTSWLDNSKLALWLHKAKSTKIFPIDSAAELISVALSAIALFAQVPVNAVKYFKGSIKAAEEIFQPLKHLFFKEFARYSIPDNKVIYMQPLVPKTGNILLSAIRKIGYGILYCLGEIPYKAYKYLYVYAYQHNFEDLKANIKKEGWFNKTNLTHLARIFKAIAYGVAYPFVINAGLKFIGKKGLVQTLTDSSKALVQGIGATEGTTTEKVIHPSGYTYTYTRTSNATDFKKMGNILKGIPHDNAPIILIPLLERIISRGYDILPTTFQNFLSNFMPYYKDVEKDYPKTESFTDLIETKYFEYPQNDKIEDFFALRIKQEKEQKTQINQK